MRLHVVLLGLQGPSDTGQAFATTLKMLHLTSYHGKGKNLDCVGHPTVMSIHRLYAVDAGRCTALL